ncbi:hypothetical protein [Ornithinimicrobium kibberense]|uniref:hypothetical protein n=1 Tax=Ornithinimicrobium kibberense TaxID=282060 RepID=UPI00361D9784
MQLGVVDDEGLLAQPVELAVEVLVLGVLLLVDREEVVLVEGGGQPLPLGVRQRHPAGGDPVAGLGRAERQVGEGRVRVHRGERVADPGRLGRPGRLAGRGLVRLLLARRLLVGLLLVGLLLVGRVRRGRRHRRALLRPGLVGVTVPAAGGQEHDEGRGRGGEKPPRSCWGRAHGPPLSHRRCWWVK